jgi:hypothetical protein
MPTLVAHSAATGHHWVPSHTVAPQWPANPIHLSLQLSLAACAPVAVTAAADLTGFSKACQAIEQIKNTSVHFLFWGLLPNEHT